MAYWLTRLATPELGLRMAMMEVCTHALCSAEDSATLVTGVLALAKKVMQRAEKLTASQSSSLSSAATRAAAAASSSSLLMHPVLESIRSDIDNSSLWDDISIKRFITHMNALADEVKKL
jgi:BRCT domain type II-containing protein